MEIVDIKRCVTVHEDGVSTRAEFWIDDNGQLQGEYKSFYENGQPERISTYLDNQLHGEVKHWFDDGQLQHHYFSYRDQLHGPHFIWSEAGVLLSSYNYRYNKPHGPCTVWDNFGRIQCKYNYKDGVFHGEYEDYSYGDSALPRRHCTYVDGECHGEVKNWMGDVLVWHYLMDKGAKHGESKAWSSDGKLLLLHSFYRNDVNITEEAMRYIDNDVMFALAIDVPRLPT